MKKVLIGSVLLITGILDIVAIIIAAAVSLTAMQEWSYEYPSRLWFLIFAGKPQMHNGFFEGVGGLGLGFFFICGVLLLILGLIILAVEYFNSSKPNKNPPRAE